MRLFPLLVTFLCVGVVTIQGQGYSTIEYPISSLIPSTLTDWSFRLLFPRFDPVLGTLAAVYVYVYASATTQINVTNMGNENENQTATGSISSTISITITTPTYSIPFYSMSQSIPSTNINYELQAGANLSYPLSIRAFGKGQTVNGNSNSNSNSINNVVVLSEFTGTGSINMTTKAKDELSILTTSGNIQGQQQTTVAIIKAYVKYYYTPISVGTITGQDVVVCPPGPLVISSHSYPSLYLAPFFGFNPRAIGKGECANITVTADGINTIHTSITSDVEKTEKLLLASILHPISLNQATLAVTWDVHINIARYNNSGSGMTDSTDNYNNNEKTLHYPSTLHITTSWRTHVGDEPLPAPYSKNWTELSVGDIMYDIGTWGLYPVHNNQTLLLSYDTDAIVSGSILSCTVTHRSRTDIFCDSVIPISIPHSLMHLANITSLVSSVIMSFRPSSISILPFFTPNSQLATRILNFTVTFNATFLPSSSNAVATLTLFTNRTTTDGSFSPYWFISLCNECGPNTTSISYTWTYDVTLDGRLPLQIQGDYWLIRAGSGTGSLPGWSNMSFVSFTFDMLYIETDSTGNALSHAQPQRLYRRRNIWGNTNR